MGWDVGGEVWEVGTALEAHETTHCGVPSGHELQATYRFKNPHPHPPLGGGGLFRGLQLQAYSRLRAVRADTRVRPYDGIKHTTCHGPRSTSHGLVFASPFGGGGRRPEGVDCQEVGSEWGVIGARETMYCGVPTGHEPQATCLLPNPHPDPPQGEGTLPGASYKLRAFRQLRNIVREL